MTRAEHMAWAKQRALEYVDRGCLDLAISSMLSDLGKHPETACGLMGVSLAALAIRPGDAGSVRKWIEGCN